MRDEAGCGDLPGRLRQEIGSVGPVKSTALNESCNDHVVVVNEGRNWGQLLLASEGTVEDVHPPLPVYGRVQGQRVKWEGYVSRLST